jgi:hypothetical protein
MAISIDPNVKGYINGFIAVCGVVSVASVSIFPDYVPPGVAKEIIQTAGLIFFLYGGANSVGNFLSSSKPGALAPPDAPVVLAAQAVANLPKDASPATVVLTKKVASEAVIDHQP